MSPEVKWGLLFALEADVENYLEKLKQFKPYVEDMEHLVSACDWLLANNPPKYVNMGQFRSALEKLRAHCG